MQRQGPESLPLLQRQGDLSLQPESAAFTSVIYVMTSFKPTTTNHAAITSTRKAAGYHRAAMENAFLRSFSTFFQARPEASKLFAFTLLAGLGYAQHAKLYCAGEEHSLPVTSRILRFYPCNAGPAKRAMFMVRNIVYVYHDLLNIGIRDGWVSGQLVLLFLYLGSALSFPNSSFHRAFSRCFSQSVRLWSVVYILLVSYAGIPPTKTGHWFLTQFPFLSFLFTLIFPAYVSSECLYCLITTPVIVAIWMRFDSLASKGASGLAAVTATARTAPAAASFAGYVPSDFAVGILRTLGFCCGIGADTAAVTTPAAYSAEDFKLENSLPFQLFLLGTAMAASFLIEFWRGPGSGARCCMRWWWRRDSRASWQASAVEPRPLPGSDCAGGEATRKDKGRECGCSDAAGGNSCSSGANCHAGSLSCASAEPQSIACRCSSSSAQCCVPKVQSTAWAFRRRLGVSHHLSGTEDAREPAVAIATNAAVGGTHCGHEEKAADGDMDQRECQPTPQNDGQQQFAAAPVGGSDSEECGRTALPVDVPHLAPSASADCCSADAAWAAEDEVGKQASDGRGVECSEVSLVAVMGALFPSSSAEPLTALEDEQRGTAGNRVAVTQGSAGGISGGSSPDVTRADQRRCLLPAPNPPLANAEGETEAAATQSAEDELVRIDGDFGLDQRPPAGAVVPQNFHAGRFFASGPAGLGPHGLSPQYRSNVGSPAEARSPATIAPWIRRLSAQTHRYVPESTATATSASETAVAAAGVAVLQARRPSYVPRIRLVTTHIKIQGAHPDQLPPGYAYRLAHVASAQGQRLMGVYVREGCIELVLDSTDWGDSTHEASEGLGAELQSPLQNSGRNSAANSGLLPLPLAPPLGQGSLATAAASASAGEMIAMAARDLDSSLALQSLPSDWGQLEQQQQPWHDEDEHGRQGDQRISSPPPQQPQPVTSLEGPQPTVQLHPSALSQSDSLNALNTRLPEGQRESFPVAQAVSGADWDAGGIGAISIGAGSGMVLPGGGSGTSHGTGTPDLDLDLGAVIRALQLPRTDGSSEAANDLASDLEYGDLDYIGERMDGGGGSGAPGFSGGGGASGAPGFSGGGAFFGGGAAPTSKESSGSSVASRRRAFGREPGQPLEPPLAQLPAAAPLGLGPGQAPTSVPQPSLRRPQTPVAAPFGQSLPTSLPLSSSVAAASSAMGTSLSISRQALILGGPRDPLAPGLVSISPRVFAIRRAAPVTAALSDAIPPAADSVGARQPTVAGGPGAEFPLPFIQFSAKVRRQSSPGVALESGAWQVGSGACGASASGEVTLRARGDYLSVRFRCTDVFVRYRAAPAAAVVGVPGAGEVEGSVGILADQARNVDPLGGVEPSGGPDAGGAVWYESYDVDLLQAPQDPGLLLADFRFSAAPSSLLSGDGPAVAQQPFRAAPQALPVVAVTNPAIAEELQEVVEQWEGTPAELDDLLLDLGTWAHHVATQTRLMFALSGAGAGAVGQTGGTPSTAATAATATWRPPLDARLADLGLHLLLYAETCGWSATAALLTAELAMFGLLPDPRVTTSSAMPMVGPAPGLFADLPAAMPMPISIPPGVLVQPLVTAATISPVPPSTGMAATSALATNHPAVANMAAASGSADRVAWGSNTTQIRTVPAPEAAQVPQLPRTAAGALSGLFRRARGRGGSDSRPADRERQGAGGLASGLAAATEAGSGRDEATEFRAYHYACVSANIWFMQLLDVVSMAALLFRGRDESLLAPSNLLTLLACWVGSITAVARLVLPYDRWLRLAEAAKIPRHLCYCATKWMIGFAGCPAPPGITAYELGVPVFVFEGLLVPCSCVLSPLAAAIVGAAKVPLYMALWYRLALPLQPDRIPMQALAQGQGPTLAQAQALFTSLAVWHRLLRALCVSGLSVLTTVLCHASIRLAYNRSRRMRLQQQPHLQQHRLGSEAKGVVSPAGPMPGPAPAPAPHFGLWPRALSHLLPRTQRHQPQHQEQQPSMTSGPPQQQQGTMTVRLVVGGVAGAGAGVAVGWRLAGGAPRAAGPPLARLGSRIE